MGAFRALRLGIAQTVVVPDDIGHVEQRGDTRFIGALFRLIDQFFLKTGADGLEIDRSLRHVAGVLEQMNAQRRDDGRGDVAGFSEREGGGAQRVVPQASALGDIAVFAAGEGRGAYARVVPVLGHERRKRFARVQPHSQHIRAFEERRGLFGNQRVCFSGVCVCFPGKQLGKRRLIVRIGQYEYMADAARALRDKADDFARQHGALKQRGALRIGGILRGAALDIGIAQFAFVD